MLSLLLEVFTRVDCVDRLFTVERRGVVLRGRVGNHVLTLLAARNESLLIFVCLVRVTLAWDVALNTLQSLLLRRAVIAPGGLDF